MRQHIGPILLLSALAMFSPGQGHGAAPTGAKTGSVSSASGLDSRAGSTTGQATARPRDLAGSIDELLRLVDQNPEGPGAGEVHEGLVKLRKSFQRLDQHVAATDATIQRSAVRDLEDALEEGKIPRETLQHLIMRLREMHRVAATMRVSLGVVSMAVIGNSEGAGIWDERIDVEAQVQAGKEELARAEALLKSTRDQLKGATESLTALKTQLTEAQTLLDGRKAEVQNADAHLKSVRQAAIEEAAKLEQLHIAVNQSQADLDRMATQRDRSCLQSGPCREMQTQRDTEHRQREELEAQLKQAPRPAGKQWIALVPPEAAHKQIDRLIPQLSEQLTQSGWMVTWARDRQKACDGLMSHDSRASRGAVLTRADHLDHVEVYLLDLRGCREIASREFGVRDVTGISRFLEASR